MDGSLPTELLGSVNSCGYYSLTIIHGTHQFCAAVKQPRWVLRKREALIQYLRCFLN